MRCSHSFRPTFPQKGALRAPGCTTRWSCETSGPAGCCDPRRGHPSIERHMNIGTIIDPVAAGDPARAALVIDGQAINYGELAAAVEQCSAHLAANGLTSGRVAGVDNGSLLSIAMLLRAPPVGAAAALMNPALTPSELRGLLDNAGCADVGIAGEAYAGRLLEA